MAACAALRAVLAAERILPAQEPPQSRLDSGAFQFSEVASTHAAGRGLSARALLPHNLHRASELACGRAAARQLAAVAPLGSGRRAAQRTEAIAKIQQIGIMGGWQRAPRWRAFDLTQEQHI